MRLTIIGLGPGPGVPLLPEARRAFREADRLYARTAHHPRMARVARPFVAFDALDLTPTALVLEAMVDALWEAVQAGGETAYAVPGHPLMGDVTVARIGARCQDNAVPVTVLPAPSGVEDVLEVVGPWAPSDGLPAGWPGLMRPESLQVADPLSTSVDPGQAVLFPWVCTPVAARLLHHNLAPLYGPDHEVILIGIARRSGARRRVQKTGLDRVAGWNLPAALYVPPLPLEENTATLGGLGSIVARLRAPGGCPWDREQSHASLKPYLLEETYEALDALDRGDLAVLQEELGDLLLNILLQAQIAAEAGEFRLSDVVRGIAEKLIRRHPHVFGDLQVATAQEVMENWETLKSRERESRTSMLAGLPLSLPSLAYTRSLQERLAPLQLTPDFLQQDLPGGDNRAAVSDNLVSFAPGVGAEALGALLFRLALEAAAGGLDPEEALRQVNSRLRERLQRLEALAWERGRSLHELSPAERAGLWRKAGESAI